MIARSKKVAGTKERILGCCIKLFNQHGVRNVSAQRIAAELKISPGHLTHFFAKRENIEAALVGQLEHVILDDIRSFRAHADPEELVEIQQHILGTLWNYRFLLQSRSEIGGSTTIEKAFRRFQKIAVHTIEQEFTATIMTGVMRPMVKPNTVRMLAENVWSLWLVSLRSAASVMGSAAAKRRALHESSVRHLSLIQPHFKSQEFIDGIQKSMEMRFGKSPKSLSDI